MGTLAIFFILCVVLFAFFCGAEMAFISSNPLKFREMADAGDLGAKRITKLMGEPENFLTTVLIAMNILHAISTALLTYVMGVYFDIHNEWVVALTMTPILLIFGEMLPKDYCRIRSETVLHQCSGLLTFIMKIFYIPTVLAQKAIRLVLTPFGSVQEKSIFVSESEFRSLIEESMKTGVVEKHEKQMIDTILDFERISTNSVMTPLDKVAKVDIHAKVEEVKILATRTKARMVLVYEEDPEIVVGMVYVFDLLFEDNNKKGMRDYLRSPTFLPGNISIETSFLTLQQRRQSYAVVTDAESGAAVGVVPIERLLVTK